MWGGGGGQGRGKAEWVAMERKGGMGARDSEGMARGGGGGGCEREKGGKRSRHFQVISLLSFSMYVARLTDPFDSLETR